MYKLLNKRCKLLGNKGFSLVELIIVIAIMAVLIAILAPQYLKYVENSKVAADNTAAEELLNAVKVALTDETIYSDATTDDTVAWAGASGDITVTSGAATLDDEILSTLGLTSLNMEVKSKTHQAQTYTINIDITNNIPSATGTWG